MTVIVYDGKSLSGDRQEARDNMRFESTKVKRINNLVVGCAGDSNAIARLEKWFANGRDEEDLPDMDEALIYAAIVVEPSGEVLFYNNSLVPLVHESGPFAIGGGSEVAMTAMHLGKTGPESVQVAIDLCPTCGMGIDVVTLS